MDDGGKSVEDGFGEGDAGDAGGLHCGWFWGEVMLDGEWNQGGE